MPAAQEVPSNQQLPKKEKTPQIAQPKQPKQTQKKQAERVRDESQVRLFCKECCDDPPNVVEGQEFRLVCGDCGLVLEGQGVDMSTEPGSYSDDESPTYSDEDETPTGLNDDGTPTKSNAKSGVSPTANGSPARTDSPSAAPPPSTASRSTTVVVNGRKILGVHKPQPESHTMGSETPQKPDRDNQLYTFEARSGAKRAADLIEDWFVNAHKKAIIFRAYNDVSLRGDVPYRKSEIGRIIDHMRWTIEFLENGREDWDLAGPDWSAKFLGSVMDKMEELIGDYERLGKAKGCRDIFHPMLLDMDRIRFKLLRLWNKKPEAERAVVTEERKKKREAEEKKLKPEAEGKKRKVVEKKMAALNGI
jgi:transcription initiation factor TFIIIB Brf1 subunit/transcription initiation factor TFIIB